MDDEYEYLRTGPGDGWKMSKELYARCPKCGYYMSLDPSADDVCPCGNMHKDAGAGRFGADSGDASIAIYQKKPSSAESGSPDLPLFTSRVTYGLPMYKELRQGCEAMSVSRAVLGAVAILYLLKCIFSLVLSGDMYGFLMPVYLAFIFFAVDLLRAHRIRLNCKRQFAANGGHPIISFLSVSGAGIRVELSNGGVSQVGFERGRKLAETNDYLILSLDLDQAVMFDKRTLTGGSTDALAEHLLSVCPNLKKRKLYSAKHSKLRKIIIEALLAVGLLLCLAQWLSGFTLFKGADFTREPMNYSEGTMNDTSFAQLASDLEALGFDSISDDTVSRLEQSWSGILEEIRAELDMPSALLTELGSGTYDRETGAWSPSSSDVYAFDMEVFSLDTMYTDFLHGVSALGGDELDFTGIEEDLDNVDWENGSGTRSVTFSWRGVSHTLDAEMMHDWFDLRFADSLNALISANCGGKQLYFGSDGYQELFVFYCDAQWAAAFEAATGMELTAKLR